MREILFRGKRVDNGEWVEGFFYWGDYKCWTFIIKYDGECINNEHEVHPESVGQFTGLLDKNGKRIFEGDVVVKDEYPYFDNEEQNYVATVDWIYSAWETVLHCVNTKKSGISDGVNERMDEGEDGETTNWEIIGNIHDNPELIGKEASNG